MAGKLVKENKCFEDLPEIDLDSFKLGVLDLVFPIGSTYVTQTEVNPNTILEVGTWERVKGKVLVGYDEDDENFNEIGKEGGESTHALTVGELPEHLHSYTRTTIVEATSGIDNTYPNGVDAVTKTATSTASTSAVGGNKAHNNLQPYKVVGYMWIRTA